MEKLSIVVTRIEKWIKFCFSPSDAPKRFKIETDFNGLAPAGIVVLIKEELEVVEYTDDQEDMEFKEKPIDVMMDLDDVGR